MLIVKRAKVMKYQRIDRKFKSESHAGRWICFITGLFCWMGFGWIHAQQIQFIKGTHQSWSGGICCRRGSHYTFTFTISYGKNPIQLDTLWTDGYCHPIHNEWVGGQLKNDSTIQIYCSVQMDDNRMNTDILPDSACYDAAKRGYFLVYRINGKRLLLELPEKKIQQLAPIAYP